MTHVLLWTQMYPKMTPFAPPWSTQKGPNGSKCATKSDMQTIIPPRCQQGGWEGGAPPPLLGSPNWSILVHLGVSIPQMLHAAGKNTKMLQIMLKKLQKMN